MNTRKQEKLHAIELNYMNALGCLLVILIHVFSIGVVRAEPSSWQGALVYLPWQLANCAVPIFLFTGAAKMSLQFGGESLTWKRYWKYIRQRFWKVYVPYALWTIAYCLVYLHFQMIECSPYQLFRHLLEGTISAQFYYIIFLMQFYLLLPVWVFIIRKISAFLALSGALMLALFMVQLPSLLQTMGIDFPYTNRIFIKYILFWVVGLYVGKHYEAVYRFIKEKRMNPALSLCFVLGFIAIAYLRFATQTHSFEINYIKLIADILSIFLILYACLRVKEKSLLQRALHFIHQSSLFVFLSHCLFLEVATFLLYSANIYQLAVLLPVRALVCYTIPFALYWGYQKAFASLRRTRLN